MRAQSGTVAMASATITGNAPGPITATSANPRRIAGKDSMTSTRRITQGSRRGRNAASNPISDPRSPPTPTATTPMISVSRVP